MNGEGEDKGKGETHNDKFGMNLPELITCGTEHRQVDGIALAWHA